MELLCNCTISRGSRVWLLSTGNVAAVTGELNILILITLNVNLNSHIGLVATVLDSAILNLSLPNYETGIMAESNLLGSL